MRAWWLLTSFFVLWMPPVGSIDEDVTCRPPHCFVVIQDLDAVLPSAIGNGTCRSIDGGDSFKLDSTCQFGVGIYNCIRKGGETFKIRKLCKFHTCLKSRRFAQVIQLSLIHIFSYNIPKGDYSTYWQAVRKYPFEISSSFETGTFHRNVQHALNCVHP